MQLGAMGKMFDVSHQYFLSISITNEANMPQQKFSASAKFSDVAMNSASAKFS